MRKSLFAVIATVCVVMTLGGCQIYGLVKDATDKEEGKIIMKDGKEYVGRVEMPNVNTKRLSIVVNDGQKTVVEAKDIASLTVWKKTHPERKHTLKYLPSEFLRKKMRKPLWMAVTATGPYVEFYTCSFDYSIPSSGYLKITSVQNGSIEHLALKKGGKMPKTISVSDISKRQKRKLLLEYLNDDAALATKINNQDIRPDDFETIAEIYHP